MTVSLRWLAALILAAAPSLLGCIGDSTTTDDEDEATLDAELTSCSGVFNCKLPNKNAANANRVTNPADGSDKWPIKKGSALHDGFGASRGIITTTKAEINYGQRKIIGGVKYVYVLGVHLDNGLNASGWVAQSNVLGDIAGMPTVSAKDPGTGDYQHVFTVTGGDPNMYGDLKVDPNFTGAHVAASDYLLREGNVVNLLYNLPGEGGVSTDTLPAGTHFHRSLGVLSIDIPLYQPGKSKVVKTMKFVYGHIGTRWGWMAHDALQ